MLNSIDFPPLLFVSVTKGLVGHQCKQGFVFGLSFQQEAQRTKPRDRGCSLAPKWLSSGAEHPDLKMTRRETPETQKAVLILSGTVKVLFFL